MTKPHEIIFTKGITIQSLINDVVYSGKTNNDAMAALISLKRNGIVNGEEIRKFGANVIPGGNEYKSKLKAMIKELESF